MTCQHAAVNTAALPQLIHNKSFWSHLLTTVESDSLKMQFINSVLIRRNVGTIFALTRPRGNLETFHFEGQSAE